MATRPSDSSDAPVGDEMHGVDLTQVGPGKLTTLLERAATPISAEALRQLGRDAESDEQVRRDILRDSL